MCLYLSCNEYTVSFVVLIELLQWWFRLLVGLDQHHYSTPGPFSAGMGVPVNHLSIRPTLSTKQNHACDCHVKGKITTLRSNER